MGCSSSKPVTPATCRSTSPPTCRRTASSPAPALNRLTDVEACQQLRGSFSRNRGAPDVLTLRIIADHVTVPRMAAEARNAVRDIDHTGVAAIPIALLREDCARAGVRIPGR